jgi:hypothetical protein
MGTVGRENSIFLLFAEAQVKALMFRILLILAVTLNGAGCLPLMAVEALAEHYSPTNALGKITNGAGIFELTSYVKTNILPSPWAHSPIPPPTVAPEIRERLLSRRTQTVAQAVFFTNRSFVGFTPGSLVHLTFTNLLALTNGRSSTIWTERTHPLGWPLRAPTAKWNPVGLMWGMRGLTALSPCWEGEGAPGQNPVTALTRRHGYVRGHGMGPDGFHQTYAGKRIWFLTTNNTLVEVRVTREIVRTMPGSGRDYTILMFNRDLPESITPIRVCDVKDVMARYAFFDNVPSPLFQTEQGGKVSAGLPGFKAELMKGGDSGSPNLLPLPGELVFYSGRTTSSPSPELQADMDELCQREGLSPGKYRLQWVDLSRFPKF